jgi:CheY-like chemotaxis protein
MLRLFDDDLSTPATPALPLCPLVSPGPAAPIVLIVEDEDVVRRMLVRLLGGAYTVFAARDGKAAFAPLSRIPVPDAIIVDVTTPGGTGLTVDRALRAEPRIARVPVLYLTAESGSHGVAATIDSGPRHYLTKPFRIGDLHAHLAAMVHPL